MLGPKFKHPWKLPWSEVTLGSVNQGHGGRLKSHRIADDFCSSCVGKVTVWIMYSQGVGGGREEQDRQKHVLSISAFSWRDFSSTTLGPDTQH